MHSRLENTTVILNSERIMRIISYYTLYSTNLRYIRTTVENVIHYLHKKGLVERYHFNF